MADDTEIVLASNCITRGHVGAQRSLLAVDRPRQYVRDGETIALPPRMSSINGSSARAHSFSADSLAGQILTGVEHEPGALLSPTSCVIPM